MTAWRIARPGRAAVTHVIVRFACLLTIALAAPSTAWAAPLVQTQPQIYIVFWGTWTSDPSGERSYLTSFVSSINGSRWLATLGQYGVGWQHTSYRGSWSDPTLSHRPGPDPSKSAVIAEATRAAHHFGVANNHNVTIIVALPPGGTCRPYHDWDPDVNVAFVAYPYNGDPFPNSSNRCAGGAQTVSHEIAEAMTDPHPFQGINNPEVGDPCEGMANNVVMHNKVFFVQELWSRSAKRCVLTS